MAEPRVSADLLLRIETASRALIVEEHYLNLALDLRDARAEITRLKSEIKTIRTCELEKNPDQDSTNDTEDTF